MIARPTLLVEADRKEVRLQETQKGLRDRKDHEM
jgi:hypothetical protein